jgi:hypothetical protein
VFGEYSGRQKSITFPVLIAGQSKKTIVDVYICPNVHRKETSLPLLNARGVGYKFKMAQKITVLQTGQNVEQPRTYTNRI